MKVRCLVSDEFVTEGEVYDVIEGPFESGDCQPEVGVIADDDCAGLTYLRQWRNNPEYEVVE